MDNPTEIEQAARIAYRAKYPSGTPWEELADSTRLIWLRWISRGAA
jgi:hypothetical protein